MNVELRRSGANVLFFGASEVASNLNDTKQNVFHIVIWNIRNLKSNNLFNLVILLKKQRRDFYQLTWRMCGTRLHISTDVYLLEELVTHNVVHVFHAININKHSKNCSNTYMTSQGGCGNTLAKSFVKLLHRQLRFHRKSATWTFVCGKMGQYIILNSH